MKSLFVQLWIAFLAVVALTLSASLAVSYANAARRSADVDQLSPVLLAGAAQERLVAAGTDGLSSWALNEIHQQPEIVVYFVDSSGRDLFNRRIKGSPIATSVGKMPPVIRDRNGTAYRVLVHRTRGLVFDFWTILFRPWVLLAIILTISAAGCALLAWAMSWPVRRFRTSVRTVASGNLEAAIDPSLTGRRDELGGLARDFETMTRDLRALIGSKEMLLRDVSHELRSPLARLRLAADLAENNVADRSEAFHRIGLEVERIDAMIGQILEYSRADSGRPASHQTFDAAMLVGELVEDARIEAEARGLTFSLSLGDNALVDGNSCQVRVAVENVIRNAIRHAPEGSDVAVETAASCDEVRIIILDRGPGVDVGDPDWIFEPFRRGTSSNGSGLGLAITRRIVEGLGGRATAANRPTGGLSVELRLPKSLALASASGTRLAPVQPCAPD